MRLRNCRVDEATTNFSSRKIVFFGKGSWLKSVEYTELMLMQDDFLYIIDNNPTGEVKLGDRRLQVYMPEKLKNERNIVVVITSSIYMYDMYLQLMDMNLDESIECYVFPFMQKVTKRESDFSIDYKSGEKKIPRIIHSFWFSGEEKNELYQQCRNSWDKYLDGYEIKEWNLQNYNWHKNLFIEKAIENKAWAFATDYARLDVIYTYGGIYLDMDVEVCKAFDDLLSNEAILSFSNNVMVDLAVLGAKKGNALLKGLLDLYEKIEPPENKKGFSDYFQPSFIRSFLALNGVRMNGCLQKVNEATVFPHEFFMPLDYVLYDEDNRNENTYCIHHDNFGWSSGKEDKKNKKIRDNMILWKMLDEYNNTNI